MSNQLEQFMADNRKTATTNVEQQPSNAIGHNTQQGGYDANNATSNTQSVQHDDPNDDPIDSSSEDESDTSSKKPTRKSEFQIGQHVRYSGIKHSTPIFGFILRKHWDVQPRWSTWKYTIIVNDEDEYDDCDECFLMRTPHKPQDRGEDSSNDSSENEDDEQTN